MIAGCDLVEPDQGLFASVERLVPVEKLAAARPRLVVDPNGITPLAGELTLETFNSTTVSIEILGALPLSHTFNEAARDHAHPVLGLYPGVENHVVVHVRDPARGVARDTLTVMTEPLPEPFPTIHIRHADASRMEAGWTLSELSLADNGEWKSTPIIFDSNGDIRWYMDLSFLGGLSFPIRHLPNGTLLVPHGRDVLVLDMLGSEIHRWRIDGFWQHHEVVLKPDGNLLIAVDVNARETVEDHIIEIDSNSGSVVREWDIREVLDVDRRTYLDGGDDWFHMNAIFYVPNEDALIVSGRNQGVIKITGDNELVWILAPHKGWGKAGETGNRFDTSEYLLTAVDASGNPYPHVVQMGDEDAPDFSWPWGQHAPLLFPNDDLFVFDNGLQRNFRTGGSNCSRGVQYQIDEEAMTVRQVWQYGCERGTEFYSSIISDVDYLAATGNRLIMPGISNDPVARALVTEVTYPDKDVVFEASIEFKNLNGSGGGWGQMDIVYRSERTTLYPGRWKRPQWVSR